MVYALSGTRGDGCGSGREAESKEGLMESS